MNAITPTVRPFIPLGPDVLLIEGRAVRIAEIGTSAEGRQILDALDAEIDQIEVQISRTDWVAPDPDWQRRVALAHKRKRRMRPRLQERIGELRRAEEKREREAADWTTSHRDARRKAFLDAAGELLGHEIMTEIWARAAELKPDLFVGVGSDGGRA